LDEGAIAELTRTKAPWLTGVCEWTPKMIKRAVIWLSQKLDKPILKLTDDDYKSEGLRDLLVRYGGAYDLIKVLVEFGTITGWLERIPGGHRQKPSERPNLQLNDPSFLSSSGNGNFNGVRLSFAPARLRM